MLLASSAFRRGPSSACLARVLRQRASPQFLSTASASVGDGDDKNDDGEDDAASSPADVGDNAVTDTNDASDDSIGTATPKESAQSESGEPAEASNSNNGAEDFLTTMSLRPTEVVNELDRHIVGQPSAKRAVAIAMRNRWRRRQLPKELLKEVTPRNVLMIGPTGCGKTEVRQNITCVYIVCADLYRYCINEPKEGCTIVMIGACAHQCETKLAI